MKKNKIFELPVVTNLGSALTETMLSVSKHEGGIKQGEINLPNFKEEVIKTEEDAKIFVETMENIPEPNDKLKQAFIDFGKQETLEEVAIQKRKELGLKGTIDGFIAGAKWQAERLYSAEEVLKILYQFHYDLVNSNFDTKEEWLEKFKK